MIFNVSLLLVLVLVFSKLPMGIFNTTNPLIHREKEKTSTSSRVEDNPLLTSDRKKIVTLDKTKYAEYYVYAP